MTPCAQGEWSPATAHQLGWVILAVTIFALWVMTPLMLRLGSEKRVIAWYAIPLHRDIP